jgi:hypothetical protein
MDIERLKKELIQVRELLTKTEFAFHQLKGQESLLVKLIAESEVKKE